jgi:hypothetical protein
MTADYAGKSEVIPGQKSEYMGSSETPLDVTPIADGPRSKRFSEPLLIAYFHTVLQESWLYVWPFFL